MSHPGWSTPPINHFEEFYIKFILISSILNANRKKTQTSIYVFSITFHNALLWVYFFSHIFGNKSLSGDVGSKPGADHYLYAASQHTVFITT